MLFENHECIQKWNLTSYHYKSWCLGQTSSTVLQISLKAFEKLTKIGFRRAGLGHVKMLNFVFGRGASPPWTPYRGVAPGPQWGPRRPPHPRPNGPSKFWRGAFGPSPKFSRVIPANIYHSVNASDHKDQVQYIPYCPNIYHIVKATDHKDQVQYIPYYQGHWSQRPHPTKTSPNIYLTIKAIDYKDQVQYMPYCQGHWSQRPGPIYSLLSRPLITKTTSN